MQNQQQIPSDVNMDKFNQMLVGIVFWSGAILLPKLISSKYL
jgi:hypothetical protein